MPTGKVKKCKKLFAPAERSKIINQVAKLLNGMTRDKKDEKKLYNMAVKIVDRYSQNSTLNEFNNNINRILKGMFQKLEVSHQKSINPPPTICKPVIITHFNTIDLASSKAFPPPDFLTLSTVTKNQQQNQQISDLLHPSKDTLTPPFTDYSTAPETHCDEDLVNQGLNIDTTLSDNRFTLFQPNCGSDLPACQPDEQDYLTTLDLSFFD